MSRSSPDWSIRVSSPVTYCRWKGIDPAERLLGSTILRSSRVKPSFRVTIVFS
jgi:hypothetical protein